MHKIILNLIYYCNIIFFYKVIKSISIIIINYKEKSYEMEMNDKNYIIGMWGRIRDGSKKELLLIIL